MSRKSSPTQYGTVAVAIHWLTALFILILLVSGFRSESTDDPATKVMFLRIHVPIGLAVLLLTLFRIFWWVRVDTKPTPVLMSPWQRRLSSVAHILLYAAVLGLSTSGIGTMVLSGAGAVIFAGRDVSTLPDFWDYLPRTPHAIVARALVGLLVLHIAAALYHHLVKKDGLMRRMWFMNTGNGDLPMHILAQLSAVLLGLLGGALLLLALAFVPYWQSLDPAAFTQWLGDNTHFIANAMIPIGFSATAVTLLATGWALWKKQPTRYWLIAASVCALCMILTFPLYFKATNAALASGTMAESDVIETLIQWQTVHWVRTIAAIAACFCAVRAGYAIRQQAVAL